MFVLFDLQIRQTIVLVMVVVVVAPLFHHQQHQQHILSIYVISGDMFVCLFLLLLLLLLLFVLIINGCSCYSLLVDIIRYCYWVLLPSIVIIIHCQRFDAKTRPNSLLKFKSLSQQVNNKNVED